MYAKTALGYIHQIIEKYTQFNREEKAIELTKVEIANTGTNPKLVYYHSMICHEPYYFNQDGSLMEHNLLLRPSKEKYLEQIKYANSVILELVDLILTKNRNSVIVIISDHGFRNLSGLTLQEIRTEAHSNFCAVYFPDRDYSQLTDSITPLNVMRLALNKALKVQAPLLRDQICD